MRKTTKAVLIAAGGVALVGACAVGLLFLKRSRGLPRSSPGTVVAPEPEPPPVRAPVQFGTGDLSARIVEALEHVVGKAHAQAAVWPLRRPRCLCVMVDGKERLYELDRGMKPDDFEGLAAGGFRPLPPEMSRTTSIYRAVAKGAVPDFNPDADRVLVLLCPRGDWSKVSLRWPPVPPSRIGSPVKTRPGP